MIYVRPMQRPLSHEPILSPGTAGLIPSANRLQQIPAMTKCIHCGKYSELSSFMEHLRRCEQIYSCQDLGANERTDQLGVNEANDQLAANVTNQQSEARGANNPLQIEESSESIFKVLQAIFPQKSEEILRVASCTGSDINHAVELVLNPGSNASCPSDNNPTSSKALSAGSSVSCFPELLQIYRKQNVVDDISKLNVDREEMSMNALFFYKKSMSDPTKLFRSFEIHFSDKTGEESSMDTGALATDFFSKKSNEASERLFEGKANFLMPKRSGGNLINYKTLGMMIGHSLLHHGPAFGAMAPWVYDVICGNGSFEHIITLIDKDMIPRNAANATAIEFIES